MRCGIFGLNPRASRCGNCSLTLSLEFVVDCIDWRNIKDALTPEEALAILKKADVHKCKREQEMSELGPKAYCTAAGWD